MKEQEWHIVVREEIKEKFEKQGFKVNSSHTPKVPNIELFRGELRRKNCLSDADIVIRDAKGESVEIIIEIESEVNPKKFIGIVLATHFCDWCKIDDDNIKPLKNVVLQIIYKMPRGKSKIAEKLAVIKEPLERIIKTNTEGSVSSLEWESHI